MYKPEKKIPLHHLGKTQCYGAAFRYLNFVEQADKLKIKRSNAARLRVNLNYEGTDKHRH